MDFRPHKLGEIDFQISRTRVDRKLAVECFQCPFSFFRWALVSQAPPNQLAKLTASRSGLFQSPDSSVAPLKANKSVHQTTLGY